MHYQLFTLSVLSLLLIAEAQCAEEAPQHPERPSAGAKMKAFFGMDHRAAHQRAQSVQVNAVKASAFGKGAQVSDIEKFAQSVLEWNPKEALPGEYPKAVLSSLSLKALTSLLNKSQVVIVGGVKYDIQINHPHPQDLITLFSDVARGLDIAPTTLWITFISEYYHSNPLLDDKGKIGHAASQELKLTLSHPNSGIPIPVTIQMDESKN